MLYKITLSQHNNFTWSRWFLLLSIVTALVLPLISFTQLFANKLPAVSQQFSLPEIMVNGQKMVRSNNPDLWFMAYFIGTNVLLFRFVLQYKKMQRFLKTLTFVAFEEVKIALNTGFGPASFGSAILLPEGIADLQIIAHEKAHIALGHHADKIFVQIIHCIFFPVIPLFFIKKELLLVHEYQADRAACSEKEQYLQLLLAQHFSKKQFPLMHTFFHHPLKKRIMMLQQSKKLSRAKKILLSTGFAVTVSAIVFLQSMSPEKVIARNNEQSSIQDSVAKQDQIKTMPEFPGGEAGLLEYIGNNVKYPANDTATGTVKVNFIISKEGRITAAKVSRSVSDLKDKEVLRVLNNMPTWTPGRDVNGNAVNVRYQLPISFASGDETKKIFDNQYKKQ